ncbi:MAG: hypothetical protein J6Y54_04680 [Lentisphaeria bacterium]|nr:hypothetical protein [Lentisphaeria bacterium]
MFVKRLSWQLGVFAALLVAFSLRAEVKVDDCFGDNMVLQRELPARIRGTADPGETVTVKFAGQTVTATADENGDFLATLAPLRANREPATLTVAGRDNTVTINNVLVGEVWLCGGQSNMFYSLFNKNPAYLHTDSEEITSQANYPLIRIASVPRHSAANPERKSHLKWQPVTPESVKSFTAVGYFFGLGLYKALDVPIGLVHSSWGGTRIEPWTTLEGFKSVPEGRKSRFAKFLTGRTAGTPEFEKNAQMFREPQRKWLADAEAALNKGLVPPPQPAVPADFVGTDRTTTGALYNGMIHPLTGMTFRGAIWYQGESNLWRWDEYRWAMHALLNGWKKAFDNPDLQFYFVQIAPWRYTRDVPRNCIGLWEAQQAFADESGCGMAVINDHGDPGDIHPHDKRPVGDRLARLALNRTYGKKEIACDAPRVKSWKRDGSTVVLDFKDASSWSTADGGDVKGFEVAGIDGVFYPAAAEIRGAEIAVSAPQVAEPRYLRYLCWNTAVGNLRNEHGLVPAPFRVTDVTIDEIVGFLTKKPGLVYEYDLFAGTPNGIKAKVDNSDKFAGRRIKRVYYLFVVTDKTGKKIYAEVSLDPFVQDLRKLALPGSKVRHNIATPIKNIGIRTNAPNLIDGDEIAGGNVEFYFTNYGPKNVKGLRNASDKVFDAGDNPNTDKKPGYGCMQFHTVRGDAIVCFSNFRGRGNADLGFGAPREFKNPDWTFSKNARNYKSAKLYVSCDFE